MAEGKFGKVKASVRGIFSRGETARPDQKHGKLSLSISESLSVGGTSLYK